jgi:hypothetical protein
MNDKQIANTIRKQITNTEYFALASWGATNYTFGDKTLTFKVRMGIRNASISITLNKWDLYDISYKYVKKSKSSPYSIEFIHESINIAFDRLVEVIDYIFKTNPDLKTYRKNKTK